MPRITFPNRDRQSHEPRRLPPPTERLRDLIRDRHLTPTAARQAIARLPGPALNQAWGELTAWECERIWHICRLNRRGESCD